MQDSAPQQMSMKTLWCHKMTVNYYQGEEICQTWTLLRINSKKMKYMVSIATQKAYQWWAVYPDKIKQLCRTLIAGMSKEFKVAKEG